MDSAYLGEQFPLKFRITDPADPERVPDSATYTIRKDGEIMTTGVCKVEGNIVSFPFRAEYAGLNLIQISWNMGQDRYITPFYLNVEAIE